MPTYLKRRLRERQQEQSMQFELAILSQPSTIAHRSASSITDTNYIVHGSFIQPELDFGVHVSQQEAVLGGLILCIERTQTDHQGELAQKNELHEVFPAEQNGLQARDQPSISTHTTVQELFQARVADLQTAASDYETLYNLYNDYALGDTAHLEQRIQALQEVIAGKATYDTRAYALPATVSAILEEHDIDQTAYTTCYGNQLQHVFASRRHCDS